MLGPRSGQRFTTPTMIPNFTPSHRLTSVALTLSLGLIGLVTAVKASAACADLAASPTALSPSHVAPALVLTPAVYRTDVAGGPGMIQAASAGRDDQKTAAIVGLWKFKLTALGNTNGIRDGTPIDFGLETWHSDGTEMIISGGRDPNIVNVCMGVWKQTGRSTFKLNHAVLSWGPPAGAYLGPGALTEVVTVDSTGNSLSGTFTFTQYVATMSNPFDQSNIAVPFPIFGVVTATRVTVD
jgi:hypothetical protein